MFNETKVNDLDSDNFDSDNFDWDNFYSDNFDCGNFESDNVDCDNFASKLNFLIRCYHRLHIFFFKYILFLEKNLQQL